MRKMPRARRTLPVRGPKNIRAENGFHPPSKLRTYSNVVFCIKIPRSYTTVIYVRIRRTLTSYPH